MSEFQKTCTYCKAKIKLSDKQEGKWLPYNLDDSSHDCRTKETKQKEDCAKVKDEFLQFLMDQLNKGYEEYKRNHPEFAKVVEKEEGKPEGSYGR